MCANVANMAGHPLLERTCGLLERAQPACSNFGVAPEGQRRMRAFFKVRAPPAGCPPCSPFCMHPPPRAAAAGLAAPHDTPRASPWLPPTLPQLNLCMAPPAYVPRTEPPAPPMQQQRAAGPVVQQQPVQQQPEQQELP